MDIIKTKLSTYKEFLPFVKDYLKALSSAHRYLYEIMERCTLYIEEIEKLLLIKSNNYFEALHVVNNIRDIFLKIMEEINVNMDDMPSEMSNTFLVDLGGELQKLNIKFEIISTANKTYTREFILKVLPELTGPVHKISTQFSQFNNTVELYAQYLQDKLDNIADNNMVEKNKIKEADITDEIEKAKYGLFPSAELKHDINFQRFGLIPVWQSLSPETLSKLVLGLLTSNTSKDPNRMYGGYSSKSLLETSNVFRESRVGLFVLVQIGKSQINFNFRTLTHKKTAQKYEHEQYTGVNDKLLKKYNNIKMLGVTDTPTFKYDRLGDVSSDKWVIVRTLDGNVFDVMGSFSDDFYFNKNFIDKFERGTSSLINGYQQMSNEKISSFLKLPQDVVLSPVTSFQDISSRVSRAVMDHLDKSLKTMPTDLKELYTISSGDEIEEIASKILIQSYENEGVDVDENISESELSSTFLSSADYIISIFVKYIKEGVAKYAFTEFMFKEKTQHALFIYIREGLSNIIQDAAKKAFDPQKDIYEKIFVKKSLLKITLK